MTSADLSGGLPIITEDAERIANSLGPLVERLSGARVLVTGASGFVPSYLADTLAWLNSECALAVPVELILLTRRPVLPGSRLGHLLAHEHIRWVVQDVSDPLDVSGPPIDYVVHAASAASPRAYLADPVGTADANSIGLRQLLASAARWETRGLLFCSSSEVYGNPELSAMPTPETYVGRTGFTGGRACYTESKRFGEMLCGAFHEQHGTPAKVARLFHTYGPGLRLDDGRIVAELMRTGLEGSPFELLSDGSATRTFAYVTDSVDGLFRVLLDGQPGEAYNVGTDAEEVAVLELAEIVAGLFGNEDPVRVSERVLSDHLVASPDRVCPDLAKLRTSLGYQPRVGLREGLERMIAWLKVTHEGGRPNHG